MTTTADRIYEAMILLLVDIGLTNARQTARWMDANPDGKAQDCPHVDLQAAVLRDLDGLGRCTALGSALYLWTATRRPPCQPDEFYGLPPDATINVDDLPPAEAFHFRFTVACWNADRALAHTLWHTVRHAEWAPQAAIRLLHEAARHHNTTSRT